jgi:voltage-gated potassium channel
MSDHDKRMEEKERENHEAWRERLELLVNVSSFLEPIMVGLGIVFLGLLLMEFAGVPLTVLGENRMADVMQAIWVIFLGDFLLRFTIAPQKLVFLTSNWLGALSLALPFLRPLRAFRAARALRGFSLVRLLGGVNRGMRALRAITRGSLMIYVAALTVAVVFAGAVGVRFFDRGYPDSPVQTFPDALWWSATLVTTISSELHVVSQEARFIALLQRLYALSIFGYITASIASYLIGIDTSEDRRRGEAVDRELIDEVRHLRRELAEVRAQLDDGGRRQARPENPETGGS